MNEKALMRKTKAELLKILRERGENPDPKILKKDLVRLILKSTPPAESSAKKPAKSKRAQTPIPPQGRKPKKPSPTVVASVTEPVPAASAADPTSFEGASSSQAGEFASGREASVPAPSELPRTYGEDRITAIVRDPYWIFAYWEVTPQGRDRARAALAGGGGDATLALRVYDVSDIEFTGHNAHGSYDIVVGSEANNWYINTGSPGRSYCVDIGLLGGDGRFATIARSECVSTPRAAPSDKIDDLWMSPAGEFEQVYALSGGFETGAASAELHELMQKQLQARISS